MFIYFEICTTVNYTLHDIHRLILGPRGTAQEDILGPTCVSEIIFTILKTFFHIITEKYTKVQKSYKEAARAQMQC
jgi:hypothetical protein